MIRVDRTMNRHNVNMAMAIKTRKRIGAARKTRRLRERAQWGVGVRVRDASLVPVVSCLCAVCERVCAEASARAPSNRGAPLILVPAVKRRVAPERVS